MSILIHLFRISFCQLLVNSVVSDEADQSTLIKNPRQALSYTIISYPTSNIMALLCLCVHSLCHFTADSEMEICYHGDIEPNRRSCCSRKMERRLHVAAEKDFYEVIRSTSSYLKNLLSSNAGKYQGKSKTVTRRVSQNVVTSFQYR